MLRIEDELAWVGMIMLRIEEDGVAWVETSLVRTMDGEVA